MIDTVTTVERNDLILPEPDGGSGVGSGRMYGYLRLRLDREIPVLPGQFAMIKPHGIAEPLLRRAMAYYRSMTAEGAPCVRFHLPDSGARHAGAGEFEARRQGGFSRLAGKHL